MPLICTHCGSQSKKTVYDRDRGSYPVCMMCGREKLKEIVKTESDFSQKVVQNDNAQVSLFDVIGKLVYPKQEEELPDTGNPIIDDFRKNYRVGTRKGIPIAIPLKKEEKPMAKEIKAGHKACTNHPDKYAVRGGLCCACIREKNGKSYRSMKKQTPEAIRIMAVREAEAMANRTEADLYRLSKKYHVSIGTMKSWIKKYETKTDEETKAPASEPKLVETEITPVKEEPVNIAEILLNEIAKRESEIRVLKLTLDILRKEAA